MAHDSSTEAHPSSRHGGEYNARPSGRHGSAAVRGSSRSGKRAAFFVVTSVWGFLVGVLGFVATLRISGTPMRASTLLVLGLLASLVVALGGARVLASAYEEYRRR